MGTAFAICARGRSVLHGTPADIRLLRPRWRYFQLKEIGMASNNQDNKGGGKGSQGGGSERGFASMAPERQREIASAGGRAAHERGIAHEFTSEEVREAGRKGGEAVSRDRQHMAEIGREGGRASGGNQGRGNQQGGG